MKLHRVVAEGIAPQAWKNGGGRTRELLAWPAADDWSLRISFADIEADGPFSAFPGITRWFAVVEGAGVALAFAAAARRDDGVVAAERRSDEVVATERRVMVADAPLRFDGAQAPHCRLLDGPTRDLNLMARGGNAAMQRARSGVAWRDAFGWRGLFARVAGTWSAGAESIRLEPLTLLWSDAAGGVAWRFDADGADAAGDVTAQADRAPCGWWLGYTPSAAAQRAPVGGVPR